MLLIITLTLCLSLCVDGKTCSSARECQGESISTHATPIQSLGYKSIDSGDSTAFDSYIICAGSYSCAESSQIEAYTDTPNISITVFCSGDHSCYNTTRLTANNANNHETYDVDYNKTIELIQCGGSESCTNIKVWISTHEIICSGDESCARSPQVISVSRMPDTIRNMKIYGYGQFSLYQSEIYSTGESWEPITVDIYLTGYYAGYSMTVQCNSNDICNLHCYGNACYNVKLSCDNLDNCNVFCNGTNDIPNTKTKWCPTSDGEFATTETPSQKGLRIVDRISDNESVCNLFNETKKFNSGLIINTNDTSENIDFSMVVECDATCLGVCCRGWKSCFNSTIIGRSYSSVSSYWDLESNLVCSGESSCAAPVFNNSNDIYGGSRLILDKFNSSLICSGVNSCANNNIIASFNGTDGQEVKIGCFGENSCVNTTIDIAPNVNFSTLYCTAGGYPCHGSRIRGVRKIYLLGGGYIDDDDAYDTEPDDLYIESGYVGEMHVYVYGYKASMNTQIMCNSTDICYLHCSVFGACSNAVLICQDEQAQCFTFTVENTNAPSFQPTTDPTNNPTNNPTYPTSYPTTIPTTMNPTLIPTKTPTLTPTVPSSMPTATPTILPTAIPTAFPTITLSTELIDFNNIGFYLVFALLALAGIMIIIGGIFHKIMHTGSDNVRFANIMRFFQSISDFWTDILFTIILYDDNVNNNYNDSTLLMLFISSCIFTLIPYIISCATGIYWILHWRASLDSAAAGGSHRLTNYLNKYELFIYGLTAFAGFYRAIDFCQTKLFYLNIFHLQLTKDELKQLQHYRFLNVVLLENLPQVCIQFYYVYYTLSIVDDNFDKAQDDESDSVVFLSLLLSVLSITTASLGYLSRICEKIRNKRSSKFNYLATLNTQISIKSMDFETKHAFAHDKLSQCIYDVLISCDDVSKWFIRSDVQHNIEVYYVQDFTKTLKCIQVTFKIEIYTLGTNETHIGISSSITQNIQNMTQKGSENFRQFDQALRRLLHVQRILDVKIQNMNLTVLNLQKQDKNSTQEGTTEGEGSNVCRVNVIHHSSANTGNKGAIQFVPFGAPATAESPDFRTIRSASDTRSGQPGYNGGNVFNFNKLTENETKMIEMLNMSIGSSPKDVLEKFGLESGYTQGDAKNRTIGERIATMHTMSLQQEEGVQETGIDDQDNFGDDFLLQTTQGAQGMQSVQLDALLDQNNNIESHV